MPTSDASRVRITLGSAARLLRLRQPRPLHPPVRQPRAVLRDLRCPHDGPKGVIDRTIGREGLRHLGIEQHEVDPGLKTPMVLATNSTRGAGFVSFIHLLDRSPIPGWTAHADCNPPALHLIGRDLDEVLRMVASHEPPSPQVCDHAVPWHVEDFAQEEIGHTRLEGQLPVATSRDRGVEPNQGSDSGSSRSCLLAHYSRSNTEFSVEASSLAPASSAATHCSAALLARSYL
jgi:hypothetical protein